MPCIPVPPNIKSNSITAPIVLAKIKLDADVSQQHHPINTIRTKGNTIAK